jgi:hypothetical protein
MEGAKPRPLQTWTPWPAERNLIPRPPAGENHVMVRRTAVHVLHVAACAADSTEAERCPATSSVPKVRPTRDSPSSLKRLAVQFLSLGSRDQEGLEQFRRLWQADRVRSIVGFLS